MVDDVEPLAAEVAQPGQDLVHERAQAAGEMAAGVALEDAPRALLLIELRAVARQPDDV